MKPSRSSGSAIQLLDKGILRLETETGNLSVPYRLTRSRRARYLRLTINRNKEVVLTLPAGCSMDRGLRFMRTKTEWLQRHLSRIGPPETLAGFLRDQGFLSVHGVAARLEWRTGAEAKMTWQGESGRVVVRFDPERHGEAQLKKALRQLAAEVLPARTHAIAAGLGLSVRQVSVRDQNSRWGSCSVRKNISLNWRLLLLAPAIADYVILHELSHLSEMNHSARFWRVLEGYDAQALAHDEALSEISNRIMSIGRVVES
jgi:predicted metal-dependent hydrolase